MAQISFYKILENGIIENVPSHQLPPNLGSIIGIYIYKDEE